ncbi:hypothetical protein DENSPDRAFT_681737 [Dentipellis sp. KUC8613]|nr:hypothetical protein DENSPDRAFT_681737 [Dentipellis sp. KUC8613]
MIRPLFASLLVPPSTSTSLSCSSVFIDCGCSCGYLAAAASVWFVRLAALILPFHRVALVALSVCPSVSLIFARFLVLLLSCFLFFSFLFLSSRFFCSVLSLCYLAQLHLCLLNLYSGVQWYRPVVRASFGCCIQGTSDRVSDQEWRRRMIDVWRAE